MYRSLQNDVRLLHSEVATMKRKMVFNDRWDKRYSKRAAALSNLALGLYCFTYYFMQSVGQRKSRVLRVRNGSFEAVVIIFYFVTAKFTNPSATLDGLGSSGRSTRETK